jgi:hypothetical protein
MQSGFGFFVRFHHQLIHSVFYHKVSHVSLPGEVIVFATSSSGSGAIENAPVTAFYSALVKGDDARTSGVEEVTHKRHLFATDAHKWRGTHQPNKA